MIEHLIPALSRSGDFIAALFFLCWAMVAASLWRLKSIRALDANRNKSRGVAVENIAHSLGKPFVMMLSAAAITRIMLAPSYPQGPFAVDLAFLAGGFTTLLGSVPAFFLIFLMSQKQRLSRPLSLGTILLSAIFAGVGQMMAATFYARKSFSLITENMAALIAPALLIGIVLTGSALLHYKLTWSIIKAERPQAGLIAREATVAILPTFFAVISAASALSSAAELSST